MRLSLGGDLSSVALGMTATARAVRESGEAIVLPMSALHATGDTPKVWVVGEDLTVRSVEVGTGGLLDDAVRIVSGLKPGDRVVTAGANLLREGQQVRLADDASGAVR